MIECLKVIEKSILKQQNPNNEDDVKYMMSHVLRKENSIVIPGSFLSTHVPHEIAYSLQ